MLTSYKDAQIRRPSGEQIGVPAGLADGSNEGRVFVIGPGFDRNYRLV